MHICAVLPLISVSSSSAERWQKKKFDTQNAVVKVF